MQQSRVADAPGPTGIMDQITAVLDQLALPPYRSGQWVRCIHASEK